MKIIKEGKIPSKKVVLNCPECGTVFEADDGEYTYTKTKAVNLSSFLTYLDKYTNLFVRFASMRAK